MKTIFYCTWEEFEDGWETGPDGVSFHLTPEDAEAYKKAYEEVTRCYTWSVIGEVKFKRIEDDEYAILESKINETKDKLGIKSERWAVEHALEE